MKSTLLNSLIISCLLAFVAAIAVAGHPLFEKVDTNKDGKIDRKELADHMKGNAFDELDNNKDEGITQTEWDKTHYVIDAEKHQEIFKAVDRDKNKRISFPEFTNYIEKYSNIEDAFMLLDKDLDGLLAPDEISYIPSFRLITIHY